MSLCRWRKVLLGTGIAAVLTVGVMIGSLTLGPVFAQTQDTSPPGQTAVQSPNDDQAEAKRFAELSEMKRQAGAAAVAARGRLAQRISQARLGRAQVVVQDAQPKELMTEVELVQCSRCQTTFELDLAEARANVQKGKSLHVECPKCGFLLTIDKVSVFRDGFWCMPELKSSGNAGIWRYPRWCAKTNVLFSKIDTRSGTRCNLNFLMGGTFCISLGFENDRRYEPGD